MMPAYNFREQFADLILSGQKPHTIRRRRKYPTKVGDVLKLFTGMRTKNCRQFAEAVCVKVEPVLIYPHLNQVEVMTGQDTFSPLTSDALEELAVRDGFSCAAAFFTFFATAYREEALKDFEIIWWDVKTLTPTLSLKGEGEGVDNG